MSEEKPAVAGDETAPEPIEAAEAPPADPLAGDEAFAPTLDPEVLSFGETKPQALVCGWCNQPLPGPDLERCPHCDANLTPADESIVVPGVTTLSEEAAHLLELAEVKRQREAARRGETMLASPRSGPPLAPVPAPAAAEIEAALRPPDDEVRRVMRELELEARRAAAIAEPSLPVEEAEDEAEYEARQEPEPPA